MAQSTNVPEFDLAEERTLLLEALRARAGGATIPELVVITGVPTYRVEELADSLVREYGGSAQTTASGEVCYSVPQETGDIRRKPLYGFTTGYRIKHVVRRLAAGFLRQWLLFLFAGYFAVFLTFLFPPVMIIFAVMMSSWYRSDFLRDSCGDSFFEATRTHGTVLERPMTHRGQRAARGGESTGQREASERHNPGSALFEYLFGRVNEKRRLRRQRLLGLLAYVRSRAGILSLEELMMLTGMRHDEAEAYIPRLLIDYHGTPEVTAQGTILYSFPELARPASIPGEPAPFSLAGPPALEMVPERAETQKNTTRTINAVNGFNFLFGTYYGAFALEQLLGAGVTPASASRTSTGTSYLFESLHAFMSNAHGAHVLSTIFLTFGVVPVGIAATFFALHLAAERRDAALKHRLSEEELRREVYYQVLTHCHEVDPTKIQVARGDVATGSTAEVVGGILDELAAVYGADIEDTGNQHYVYHFPEIERELLDLESTRAWRNASSSPAQAVKS